MQVRTRYKNSILLLLLLGTLFIYQSNSSQKISSEFQVKPEDNYSFNSEIINALSPLQYTDKLACGIPDFYRSVRSVVHHVKSGETLGVIFKNLGVKTEHAGLVAEALFDAGLKEAALHSGEELEFHLIGNEVQALKKNLGDGKVLHLEAHAEGYEPKLIVPKVISKDKTISGTITSSFFQAAAHEEVPYSVIDELVDLFSSRVEFSRSMQPGDTFSLVYTERRTESGDLLAPGPIKAASIENMGKFMAAVRHVGKDGIERFYNENGETLGDYFLRYPLNFTRISSSFSHARFHPVRKVMKPHNGVDFAAPVGTPVRTIADGIVEYAGYNGGAGNMVKIRHNDRYTTAYLHLSKISVKQGTRISRGTVIGQVGQTGWATGPHLHFSFYDRGKYVDPMKIDLPNISQGNSVIPVNYLKDTIKLLKNQHEDVKLVKGFEYKSIG